MNSIDVFPFTKHSYWSLHGTREYQGKLWNAYLGPAFGVDNHLLMLSRQSDTIVLHVIGDQPPVELWRGDVLDGYDFALLGHCIERYRVGYCEHNRIDPKCDLRREIAPARNGKPAEYRLLQNVPELDRYFIKKRIWRRLPISLAFEVTKQRFIHYEGEAFLFPKSGKAGDVATGGFSTLFGLEGWIDYLAGPMPARGVGYRLAWLYAGFGRVNFDDLLEHGLRWQDRRAGEKRSSMQWLTLNDKKIGRLRKARSDRLRYLDAKVVDHESHFVFMTNSGQLNAGRNLQQCIEKTSALAGNETSKTTSVDIFPFTATTYWSYDNGWSYQEQSWSAYAGPYFGNRNNLVMLNNEDCTVVLHYIGHHPPVELWRGHILNVDDFEILVDHIECYRRRYCELNGIDPWQNFEQEIVAAQHGLPIEYLRLQFVPYLERRMATQEVDKAQFRAITTGGRLMAQKLDVCVEQTSSLVGKAAPP